MKAKRTVTRIASLLFAQSALCRWLVLTLACCRFTQVHAATWTRISNPADNVWLLATGRSAAAAAKWNSNVLIWGGVSDQVVQKGLWQEDEIVQEIEKLREPIMSDGAMSWNAPAIEQSGENLPQLRKFHTMEGPFAMKGNGLFGDSLASYVIFGGELVPSSEFANDQGSLYVMTVKNANLIRWDKFAVTTSTPQHRVGHATAMVGTDSMYMFGGYFYDGTSRGDRSNDYLEDLWLLSWQENGGFHWTMPFTAREAKTNLRPSFRKEHSLTSFPTNLVLFGGSRYTYSSQTSFQGNIEFLNDVWVLEAGSSSNLASGSNLEWKNPILNNPATAKPAPRAGHAAVRRGNSLLVHGGYSISRSNERIITFLDDLWELDTTSWTWSQLLPSGSGPSASSWHLMLLLGSNLISIGGTRQIDINQAPLEMTVIEATHHILAL